MASNLHTPDSPESAQVREGNIAGIQEKPRGSVSITSDTTAPGASGRNTYKPGSGKKRAIAIARGEAVPRLRPDMIHGRVQKVGATYLSAEDTAKKTKAVDSDILSLAKELYKEESDARKRFKRAKEIINEASEEELKNPSTRLNKAFKIVERGVMDKKKAKKIARTRLIRQREVRL